MSFEENKNYNRIKELRLAKGHTSLRDFVRFICEDLHYEVSTATISLLEAHRRENPAWELVDVLCDYFNVSPDYLMGKTDVNSHRKPVVHSDSINLDAVSSTQSECKTTPDTPSVPLSTTEPSKETISKIQLPPEFELLIQEYELRMKQLFLAYQNRCLAKQ